MYCASGVLLRDCVCSHFVIMQFFIDDSVFAAISSILFLLRTSDPERLLSGTRVLQRFIYYLNSLHWLKTSHEREAKYELEVAQECDKTFNCFPQKFCNFPRIFSLLGLAI